VCLRGHKEDATPFSSMHGRRVIMLSYYDKRPGSVSSRMKTPRITESLTARDILISTRRPVTANTNILLDILSRFIGSQRFLHGCVVQDGDRDGDNIPPNILA